MLPTNKPIVNFSVRELSRMQTLLHYELMALHEESKEAKIEMIKAKHALATEHYNLLLQTI